MSQESNFTHEVILPSKGLLNPEIPGGRIIQRCLMVSDQKKLAGSKQTAGNAINFLLQNTVVEPEGFDVKNLSPMDSMYLLFKLKSISYGDLYKFRTRCPECGKKIDVEIDFSTIPVTTLDEDYRKNLELELPRKGDKVILKMMTNDNLDALNEEIGRRRKKNPNDESIYILDVVYHIEKIKLKEATADGKKELTHPLDIELYISALTDMDYKVIQMSKDKVFFGVSTTAETTCPECGRTIDVNIQFNNDFFRPYLKQ